LQSDTLGLTLTREFENNGIATNSMNGAAGLTANRCNSPEALICACAVSGGLASIAVRSGLWILAASHCETAPRRSGPELNPASLSRLRRGPAASAWDCRSAGRSSIAIGEVVGYCK